jgi:hypothetical protein
VEGREGGETGTARARSDPWSCACISARMEGGGGGDSTARGWIKVAAWGKSNWAARSWGAIVCFYPRLVELVSGSQAGSNWLRYKKNTSSAR